MSSNRQAFPFVCKRDYNGATFKIVKWDPQVTKLPTSHKATPAYGTATRVKIWDLPTTEKGYGIASELWCASKFSELCARARHEALKLHRMHLTGFVGRVVEGQLGLRKGNWLDGSKLEFLTIVRFMYFWCELVLTLTRLLRSRVLVPRAPTLSAAAYYKSGKKKKFKMAVPG
jgi:hypothetical protein